PLRLRSYRTFRPLPPRRSADLLPAYEAVQRAVALAGKASDVERALIQALTRRYAKDPKANRAALDSAYARAMGEVASRWPEDATDRKSTRLNSSHVKISYAVFC